MGNRMKSNWICSIEGCSLKCVTLQYYFLKREIKAAAFLGLCPILILCVEFDWLTGNGVYEKALVCFLPGGEEKWITVLQVTKQVLGWHWGRA